VTAATQRRESLHLAVLTATTTLVLLEAANSLPGRLPILRVVQSFARKWEASFWERYRQPEPSLLVPLIRDTFDADLAVERERELWRRAAGLAEQRQRFVRKEWRARIVNLRSLDDTEKQNLAAQLRGKAMLEAEGPTSSLTVLMQSIELPEGLDGQFRQGFHIAFEDAMTNGSRKVAAQLGFAEDWLLADPAAVGEMGQYAGYYGDRLTKLVPMEWQVEIRKAMITGLDEGMSAVDMGSELRGVWDNLETWQAERIARTEAVRARMEGRRSTYLAAGIQMLEWVLGPHPCPVCRARAGRRYPVGSRELPPTPHPHCECDAVASDDDLDRMRAQALAGTGAITPLPSPMAPRYAQG